MAPELFKAPDPVLRDGKVLIVGALDLGIVSLLAGLPCFGVGAEIRKVGASNFIEDGSPIFRNV
jgi:hypothetical protein